MGGMLVCGVLGDAMSREKNHTEWSIETAHHWASLGNLGISVTTEKEFSLVRRAS